MTPNRKLILVLFFAFISMAAHSADIDGQWHGNLTYWFEVALDVKADGKKLTGMFYSTFGDNVISDGKLNGNEFSFNVLMSNKLVPWKGKIEGDRMSISVVRNNETISGELKRVPKDMSMPVPLKPQVTEFYEPVPPIIDPGPYAGMMAPPADAIVLFDGKDLSKWKGRDGDAQWTVADGVFTVKKGTGDIETKEKFNDYQLHIEWRIPQDIDGKGQGRGNSGIFMQGIYELQVLDSYQNDTYTNGQAGSIYKQKAPLANAMRKPGEWNVYDVVYTAPRFKDDGTVLYPAKITVIHNGVLIQNNFEIKGDTPYIGFPKYTKHGQGPIRLQDHGDPSKPISFRNIWLRKL